MMDTCGKKFFRLISLPIFVMIALSHINAAVGKEIKIDDEWCFLSTTTIGAKQFITTHPDYDGRGVVIFICDSGVDMGIPGLKLTTTGQVKVIDVRDFSGQGDVALYVGEKGAEDREKYIEHPDGFRLYNYHLLDYRPVDDEYLIGYLDEKRFKNSNVKDINNNGKQDDLFGILVFEVEMADTLCWIAYVDTDGDQHLEDEKPIRDYHLNYDSFQLRGGDKKFDRRFMTFALNILPYEMKVSVHFDDDGHGTHVAGIAAGYNINNQRGLNGVAPGAQIISLKIGNGIYEGGCTVTGSIKKALDFAEDYARTHRVPVVINLSYGIGSLREGESDIDHFVNNLITYNDNIFVTVSNGNEGPGISTAGTPAAAHLAFSVGALLPHRIANQCYGTHLSQDKIFYFSARGGELNKPDAVAPGIASSTVPKFADDDVMRGTSMAAPQVAGAAAILLSAAKQSSPEMNINTAQLKRSLKYGATPMKGYTDLDQGWGIINIPQAFKILKALRKDITTSVPVSYDISTVCPTMANELAPSAFWRNHGYFPADNEQQVFYVNAIFGDSLNADDCANFYRAFNLKSSHPWLTPVKKSIYIKGETPTAIAVKYDQKLLTEPGLYSGKIIAYRKSGLSSHDPANIEFELLNTIIIPYIFDHRNNYRQQFNSRTLMPGDVERYFILVPTGAKAAKITISATKNKFCNVAGFCYTPQGKKYFRTRSVKSNRQDQVVQLIPAEDLSPGIWEVDIYADYLNDKKSTYDLTVSFNCFEVTPPVVSNFNYQIGHEPNGHFKLTNRFNVPFNGFSRGKILGYQRTRYKTVKNQNTFSYNFSVVPEIKKVEFLIDFEDETFLKLTDAAINIYNSKGRAVVKESLTLDQGKIVLRHIDDEFYTLEIHAAFVYPASNRQWKFKLTEKYYTDNPINLKIYAENDRLFKLYPDVTRELEFTLDQSPHIAPDGFEIFGYIEFIDRNLLQQEFMVPVLFESR